MKCVLDIAGQGETDLDFYDVVTLNTNYHCKVIIDLVPANMLKLLRSN